MLQGSKARCGREKRQRQVLHGNQLVLFRCVVCKRWVVVRCNSADLDAHINGVFIQDAMPYLAPELRELFISSTCPNCWSRLCPDPIKYPNHYN